MKHVLRWVTDWRTIAAVTAAALVAYLGVLVVTSIQDRGRALDAAIAATASEREARQAAVHRIDQLLKQIGVLQQDAQGNGQLLALLREELALLQQQIRDMGGHPVIVAAGGSPSPQPRSSASSSATPRPRPTPTSPRPTPSPSRTCVPLARICI